MYVPSVLYGVFEICRTIIYFNRADSACRTKLLEFVQSCVNLEDEAGKKTRAFFAKHPLQASPLKTTDVYYKFYFTEGGLALQAKHKELGGATDNTKYFQEIYESEIAPKLGQEKDQEKVSKDKADKEKVSGSNGT